MDISTATLRYFVPFSELLASIVGTIYFYKYKRTHLRYFLILLWYITISEFFSWYATKNDVLIYIDENGVKYNLWIYNLMDIFYFNILYLIFFKSLENLRYKLWIKIICLIFNIILIVNWSFIQNFVLEWSELPYIFGSLSIIIIVIFYFIELLKSEKIIIFHRMLLFWISIGLLLFHTGSIPFSLKINGYALIPGIHKLFLILTVLALIMYSIFTFGFIWSKKE